MKKAIFTFTAALAALGAFAENTYYGQGALESASAYDTSAYGEGAGRGSTRMNNSVLIGRNSGYGMDDCRGCVCIGSGSMNNASGNERCVAIGANEMEGLQYQTGVTSINGEQIWFSQQSDAFSLTPRMNDTFTNSPIYYKRGELHLNADRIYADKGGGLIGGGGSYLKESYSNETAKIGVIKASEVGGALATVCTNVFAVVEAYSRTKKDASGNFLPSAATLYLKDYCESHESGQIRIGTLKIPIIEWTVYGEYAVYWTEFDCGGFERNQSRNVVRIKCTYDVVANGILVHLHYEGKGRDLVYFEDGYHEDIDFLLPSIRKEQSEDVMDASVSRSVASSTQNVKNEVDAARPVCLNEGLNVYEYELPPLYNLKGWLKWSGSGTRREGELEISHAFSKVWFKVGEDGKIVPTNVHISAATSLARLYPSYASVWSNKSVNGYTTPTPYDENGRLWGGTLSIEQGNHWVDLSLMVDLNEDQTEVDSIYFTARGKIDYDYYGFLGGIVPKYFYPKITRRVPLEIAKVENIMTGDFTNRAASVHAVNRLMDDRLGGATFRFENGGLGVYTNGVKAGTLTFSPSP